MRAAGVAIVALAAVMLGALAPSAARAETAAWDVGALMRALGEVKTSRAHFVERRYLHMLSEPLKASGTLSYVAPDKLQKVTLEPKPETLVVDGDTLTVERAADGQPQSRRFSLQDHPEMFAFVESIRATLAGDLTMLNHFYTVSLAGSATGWQLALEPREARMRELVKQIRIAGSERSIHTVDTEERDGDRTEMIILEDAR